MRIGPSASTALTILFLVACGEEAPPPEFVETPAPAQPEAEPEPDPPAAEDAPPETAAAAATPQTSTVARRAYTVQVGAFVERSNADATLARLRQDGWPAWDTRAEVQGTDFGRVRVGVVSEIAQARRLAQMIESGLGLSVWVAPLNPGESVPEGIEEATRERLGTG